jgi:hypothetical protein
MVTAGCAITVLSASLSPQSAEALPPLQLDASTADISFVSATDVLSLSEAGDSVDYLNIAVIDGHQIDATLTVEETFNLVAEEPFFFLSDALRTYVNDLDDGREELVESGCYQDALNGDGDPWGMPIETTLASDYLVGSDNFDKTTAWAAGSNYVDGSVLPVADEVFSDNDEDRAINTTIGGCGGVAFYPTFTEYYFPAYVRYRIDFHSAGTPVELFNLTLSALDIDGGQYLRLFAPLPDSYRVFDSSLLEVCGPSPLVATECEGEDEYAGSSSFLSTTAGSTIEFYGDDSSDDGEVKEWAADATYTQPTSYLKYQFGVRLGGGGFLGVRFDPVDWTGGSGGGSGDNDDDQAEEAASIAILARTGADAQALDSGAISLLGIGLGAGMIIVARRLGNRSRLQ